MLLGGVNILPVRVYAFFSRKCKYIPVFTDALNYYGDRSIGRFLFDLGLKALGVSLELSQRRIPTMFALSKSTREGVQSLAPNLRGDIALVSYPIHSRFSLDQKDSVASSVRARALLKWCKLVFFLFCLFVSNMD